VIAFKITGGEDIAKAVNGLSKAVYRAAGTEILLRRTRGTLHAMRNKLRVSNEATGALKDSLGQGPTQNARRMRTAVRIGSRVNAVRVVDGKVSRPARTVHLTELGFAHEGGGTVPAQPFIRPAWEATQDAVSAGIQGDYARLIEKTAVKRAARATRRAAR
jgi:hypothetical protein